MDYNKDILLTLRREYETWLGDEKKHHSENRMGLEE